MDGAQFISLLRSSSYQLFPSHVRDVKSDVLKSSWTKSTEGIWAPMQPDSQIMDVMGVEDIYNFPLVVPECAHTHTHKK